MAKELCYVTCPTISVKTNFEGDVRRFGAQMGQYEAFCLTLKNLYPNVCLCVEYTDDDRDLIKITSPEEFNEALRVMCYEKKQRADLSYMPILRLTLTIAV